MTDSYSPAEIAEVAHEANRVVQRIHNAHHPDTGIPVAAPWAEFDEHQASGVVSGVVNALAGATPAESHANWCAEKIANGWQWGPVKDAEARTHPCLVDYDDLPDYQRDKDELFLAVVHALGEVAEPELDMSGRHPGVQDVARYLLNVNTKLDGNPAMVARLCRLLAVSVLQTVEDSPQLTNGLGDLLRAKDAFCRAALPREDA